ncbi:MAG TPA: hypothetical protein VJH88_03760 [Candidatus Nanoarchaeia archaeon]|nr:hypothetical protein [Candidatus Nanoarchaeia archaeon]
MVQVTIKDVDEGTFRELKAEAAREGISVGKALSWAVKVWLSEMQKPRLSLLSWKTFKGGKGTQYLSEEIDDILYGEKSGNIS